MTDTTTTAPGQATRRYLQALRERTPGPIDWSAAPAQYKRYPSEGRIVLPWAVSSGEPQLALISTLLRHLLGLRPRWAHPMTDAGLPTGASSSVTVGRPAPSGGALYPIEAYLATSPAPGLYHYDAAHHCLDLIRTGDHRTALVSLLTTPPPALPDLVLVLSAVFWRNGFKYGDFAYRLHCQETGVLTAQCLALAEVLGLTATMHLNFTDGPTQDLLGLDPTRESPLAVLTLTTTQTPTPAANHPSVTELIACPAIQASNPPPGVTDSLPHLIALHTTASHCPSGDGDIPPLAQSEPRNTADVRLPPARPVRLADGIAARASAPTGYQPRVLDPASLATVLACAAAGYPGDLPGSYGTPVSVTPYLLVQRIAGIAPGAYRYQPNTHTLIPVGDPHATALVTQSPLQPNTRHALPEAAAVLIPVGDPLAGIPHFGDRWYRIQQIETGLMIHYAILAATALGLAARIHSDGTNDTTNTALGLAPTSLRSLSFVLLGHHRPGPTLHGYDSNPLLADPTCTCSAITGLPDDGPAHPANHSQGARGEHNQIHHRAAPRPAGHPNTMSIAAELRQLVKRYPKAQTDAIDRLSFTVNRGEIFGLLGPNGAGKSTTIGVLTTRIRPSGGQALIAGVDVMAAPRTVRSLIGVVPQRNNLDRSLSVRQNLLFHAAYHGVPKAVRARRAEVLLEQFALTERAHDKPDFFSGGQNQRMMIARALMHDPKMLFLDEPTTGLDPAARLFVWDRIRELRTTGVTIVLSTHDMDEAATLADRVGIIDAGRLLALDTPASLIRGLAAAKAGAGAQLSGVEISEARSEDVFSLEDVFIDLTGRSLR